MKASERQVGGDHYKSEYQHWDWAIDIRLGYLESAASKYIGRWRDKNGVQDTEKAVHYLEKALEANNEFRYSNSCLCVHENTMVVVKARKKTQMYVGANCHTHLESEFMFKLTSWRTYKHLEDLISLALQIQRMATAASVKGAGAGGKPQSPSSGLNTKAMGQGNALPPIPKAPPPLDGSTKREFVSVRGFTDHPSPFGYEGDD